MKQISLTIISFLVAFTIYAQQVINTVTIVVNSSNNIRVTIDGRNYNLNNNNSSSATISITSLVTGQHSFLVSRTSPNTNSTEKISTTFNLRNGFDMMIRINTNGSIELIETKKTGNNEYHNPMTPANFNALLNNVKQQRSTNGKRTVIANAFNRVNNYFSTNQVVQLIQQVNSESFRLQLAKLAYPTITDRNNFNQVYDLLNSQASRNELDNYINDYNNGDTEDSNDNNTNGAMSDANFNTLYQTIQKQWPVNTQINSITNAFNNTNNNFNTYQARQLILLISSESNRLQLAKLSYRSIVDRNNFTQLYDVLNSQSSKDELTAYVNNYNGNGNNSNGAMSDANFNSLYQTIQQQWPVNTQISSITNAFNNSNNYFTTYQAKQLIQLISSESSRLELAKMSYRSIVDKNNFNQLYDLFNSQSSKDELAAYINNYGGNSGNYKEAMTDANYNSLYQSIQMQFLPGERMNSLTATFNNNSYYFTSAQAKKLILLITFESNRLQLAKLSYRTIVDRNNFNQLQDLFNSQASRDELDAYVRAFRD
jgi:Domain of unknown function (DUF4476)